MLRRINEGSMDSAPSRLRAFVEARGAYLFIIIVWLDFWVKFVLRLMHCIHALIHVIKFIPRGQFYPINAHKIILQKDENDQYLGKMVTYNNCNIFYLV